MFIIAFGFLFAIFISLTLVLWILKLIFKKKIINKIILGLWIFFISIPILLLIISIFTTKMELDKEEIYGNYVIDRSKCSGKQSDWQYNHYRFKITKDNKICFYITEKEKIIKTIEGKVEIKEYYTPSPRLKIIFKEPSFHIIKDNPTLYREIWSFYYVFYSEKYQNVFFKKGNWKSID